jgi:hypothetical protein
MKFMDRIGTGLMILVMFLGVSSANTAWRPQDPLPVLVCKYC